MSDESATRTGSRFITALQICIMGVAFWGATHPALGQKKASAVTVGDRVRVVAADSSLVLDGVLRGITGGSVQLGLEDGPPQAVSVEDIENLYVLRERGYAGKGALIGLLPGAITGGAISATSWEPCEGLCFFHPNSRGEAFTWGALLGAIPGLLLGAVVGSFVRSSSWQHVDLDVALMPERVSAATAGRQAAPSFRLVIPLGN